MKLLSSLLIACLTLVATCSQKRVKPLQDSTQDAVEQSTQAETSGKNATTQPQKTQAQTAKKDATDEASTKRQDETEQVHFPGEKHFKNIQQLTFGGENAEAYFSFDGTKLVMQRTNEEDGVMCDQIYWGNIPKKDTEKFEINLVSTGKGRTTCSYFMPGDERVIFASTHDFDPECPPTPDREKIKKYVWPIYDSFEIYTSKPDGSDLKRLTNNKFYDAEATVSPDGTKIVYTSNKSGDLELYVMNVDGSNEVQVTDGLGYDGGAFFSPDSKRLVFRSSRPKTDAEVLEYKELLADGLVAPTEMELYVCDIDGKNLQQVTNLGKANWAPFFHPSGEKIVFSSNHQSEFGFPFNLFMIDVDGSNLEKLTFGKTFESFPMFSPDGKKIVFSSNRNNGDTRDTNVFIADWVD